MNSFLLYILKSTFCISLFYLGFRMLLRKETFFRLNRILLLSAVIFSAIIPAIPLPQFIQPAAQNEWISAFPETVISEVSQPIYEETVQPITALTKQTKPLLKEEFPWMKLVQNTYLAGIVISFLILIYGITSILVLFRKARFMQLDGFRLLIIDRDVPPFSFGRFVIISQADYDAHQQTILAHEEAHIRLNHFFDLAVLETVKLFHWFNPAMYWLIRDMKEIHEYQADQYTLNKGIDATQYQILIIQKSVGPQRFALANSFNHCQIKKRITMMNKSKTSKARLWKVATFLPLLALLLMAFGKPGENAMDFKVTQNPVNQKSKEKQSVMSGLSREQLLEYENIVNKVKDKNGVPELRKISDTDKKRLETLYLSMNTEQRAAQIVIFISAPPPLPRFVPTIEQMKTWEDSKIYGLWINDKRVNNSDLKNYTNKDFACFFVSKLEKNAINYGKHFYQVNLMTNEYYANYLAKRELAEKYFIALRKKKEVTFTEHKVNDQTKIDTKGQVLKSNGQPMQGASVLLKGSTLGTMTDQEGKFELKGIQSDSELLIFHTGYKNKVMKVTDKTMRIIMEEGKFAPPPPPTVKDNNLSNGSGNLDKIDTKGQVLNSEGKPLPEASVLLLGSTYGTITDQEGKFELKGIPSDGELAVTSLGFSPKVLKVSGQPLKIKMETETIANDKVSANGQKIPPPPPTLVLSKMYACLIDRPNPPSIFQDGLQIERKAMEKVDVNGIQNVKIMMDQEATDKYGDQGKDGVIQITMKSAKQKTLVK